MGGTRKGVDGWGGMEPEVDVALRKAHAEPPVLPYYPINYNGFWKNPFLAFLIIKQLQA